MANRQSQQDGLAAAIGQVSEHAVGLVRQEVELVKAELKATATTVSRGAIVGIAAGFFALLGFIFILQSLAWALWQLIFGSNDYWGGFLLVALLLFIVGGIAGYLAYRWLQPGKQPAPVMAIDEAKLIRDTVETSAAGEAPPPPIPGVIVTTGGGAASPPNGEPIVPPSTPDQENMP